MWAIIGLAVAFVGNLPSITLQEAARIVVGGLLASPFIGMVMGLVSRGFSSRPVLLRTITAVDTLVREQSGELPRGLYLAYVMLEPIHDAAQRRSLLEQFIDKYPRFAPGWQQFANLIEDGDERLKAIEKGLAASPDPETKGMLLLNKALVLHSSGSHDMAVRLLSELVADPHSTLGTEALAKAMLERMTAR